MGPWGAAAAAHGGLSLVCPRCGAVGTQRRRPAQLVRAGRRAPSFSLRCRWGGDADAAAGLLALRGAEVTPTSTRPAAGAPSSSAWTAPLQRRGWTPCRRTTGRAYRHRRIAFLGDLRVMPRSVTPGFGGSGGGRVCAACSLVRHGLHGAEAAEEAPANSWPCPCAHRVQLGPCISVIARDRAAIGREAAGLLFDRLDGERGPARHRVPPTRYLARGSSETPPQRIADGRFRQGAPAPAGCARLGNSL
jgi:hypothetical protein